MFGEGFCGCNRMRPSKILPSLFISFVVLTNVCDSKAVTFTGLRKTQFPSSNNSQSQRHTIRWLIKQTTGKEDEGFWHIIAKTMDKKIVERLRKKRKSDPIYEQPTNRREVRLLSKTGFFLEVLPSGKVGGNINKTKYTKMEIQVFSTHVKRIKSVATGKYVAISKNGKVVAKDTADLETFLFEEVSEHFQHLYSSIKYPKSKSRLSWYLGLKRRHGRRSLQGRVKRASKTLAGDSATHFSIFY